MSFAVIQTGGKQYKVSASEILKIERLNSQVGKTVEFKNVLFLNDDKNTEIGNPNIKGAKVEATILKNTKNRTVLVFKKRRRKNSRKKYGHRQPFTLIRINKIFSKDGKILASAVSAIVIPRNPFRIPLFLSAIISATVLYVCCKSSSIACLSFSESSKSE